MRSEYRAVVKPMAAGVGLLLTGLALTAIVFHWMMVIPQPIEILLANLSTGLFVVSFVCILFGLYRLLVLVSRRAPRS